MIRRQRKYDIQYFGDAENAVHRSKSYFDYDCRFSNDLDTINGQFKNNQRMLRRYFGAKDRCQIDNYALEYLKESR